jgi:zinc protease
MVTYRLLEGLFRPGHPYRHPPIGSMQDLDAARLEDVHKWFKDYYGASNTVLVLAGDIKPKQARKLASKYFSHIPAGPPVTRLKTWVPELSDDIQEVMFEDVPQARIYRTWAVPGWVRKDRLLLQLVASILGDGKNARLHQALVTELQFAVTVSVEIQPFELASLFAIDTTLAPDVSVESVNDIIDQELQVFLRDGPGQEELVLAQTRINAGIIRGLERVGGFQGKATTLAQGELYDGNPDFYKTALSWINKATTLEVREAARRWLTRGAFQLDVLPFGEHKTDPPSVDRSLGLPTVGELPDLIFPDIQSATLSNGMRIVLAERHAIPVVSLALQFDSGYAADTGRKPGTAAFTLAMMGESTRLRTASEIELETQLLGAEISTSSDLDSSRILLSALQPNLEPSIELFADVARNPAFAAAEMDRLRTRWLAGIESEKSEPVSLALRILPPLIYGPDHAYGIPFTGSGTRQSINQLSAQDLVAFHQDWIRPDNGTLFVVGDTTLKQVVPLLEKYFGDWQAPDSPRPQKIVGDASLPGQSRVLIIDKPGASQSVIMAAHLAPPTGDEETIAIEMMNDVLGGTYSARINQELRTNRQWSYGAFSFMRDARGQRPWMVYAPVQSDRTADSVRELLALLRQFSGTEPASAEELKRVYRSSAFSLPGQYETSAAILEALLSNDRYARPDNYVPSLKARYENTSLENIHAAAQRILRPDKLTWVVVGDRDQIEDGLRELGIAELEFMDTEGQLIK